jgi:hypothetical protein
VNSTGIALEYVGHPTHVIDVRVSDQKVAGGVGPAVLGQGTLEQRHVPGLTRSGVEQDGTLARSNQEGVGSRAGEQARVQAADHDDAIGPPLHIRERQTHHGLHGSSVPARATDLPR